MNTQSYSARCCLILTLVVFPMTIHGFTVFEHMKFSDRNTFHEYSMPHMPLMTSSYFWPPDGDDELPPADIPYLKKKTERLKTRATNSFHDYIALDIEHWPTSETTPKIRKESIDKYIETIRLVRAAAPNTKLGYYLVGPIRDYWRAVKPSDSRDYLDWQIENDSLGMLIEEVDVLFPSLYTFYDEEEAWEKYATANLSEARRIANGKSIIAFLWPRYHESGSNSGEYIGGDFWRRQLELVYKYADAVVIWNNDSREEFNASAPWWVETIDFMEQKGLHRVVETKESSIGANKGSSENENRATSRKILKENVEKMPPGGKNIDVPRELPPGVYKPQIR